MTPLPSVAAIYEQLEQVRRTGPLVTNFYPVPDKLQRSIERGELFSLTAGNVVFVLRRDRDFLHLSFVASTAAELAGALRERVASLGETVTVDLLGPRERVAEIAEPFAQAGFRGHCTLHRMTRVAKQTKQTKQEDAASPPPASDPEVVFASRDDAAELAGMLDAALDRHAEQIPDEDELARAASERKILVIRSGPAAGKAEPRGVGTPVVLPAGRGASPAGSIAGLLFFEVTGQSSLLRHWLVDPAHRDQRIGARLMRRYLADCKDVRRFLLWVISDNHNAIDRYRHYGYQQDGLIDQVLIRRPS
ncbi:MAG TPA: GNAT family N-acetyltransferase [Kofleriaceae bacterium]|nr:GNAT family N-acetyltransferase [Kofleriaceae bacterium]